MCSFFFLQMALTFPADITSLYFTSTSLFVQTQGLRMQSFMLCFVNPGRPPCQRDEVHVMAQNYSLSYNHCLQSRFVFQSKITYLFGKSAGVCQVAMLLQNGCGVFWNETFKMLRESKCQRAAQQLLFISPVQESPIDKKQAALK